MKGREGRSESIIITDVIDQEAGRGLQGKLLRIDCPFKSPQTILGSYLLKIDEVISRISYMEVTIDIASRPFIELEPEVF